MTKVIVTRDSLEDTADSIRSKLGVQTTYKPSQFADAIDSITGVSSADNGKGVVNGALTSQTSRSVIANGTYDTTTNNQVVVNVSGDSAIYLIKQEKLENILTATGSSERHFVEGFGQHEIVKEAGNPFTVKRSSYVENNKAYLFHNVGVGSYVSMICPTLIQPNSYSKIKIRYFIRNKANFNNPTLEIGAGTTAWFYLTGGFNMDLKSTSLIGSSKVDDTLYEDELDISDLTTPFYFGMTLNNACVFISDLYIT